MYGCKDSPYYYVGANDLVGSDFEEFGNQNILYAYGDMYLPICRNSKAHPYIATFIFVTFILLCGFILISLTVAVVTAGIRDRIEQIQQLRGDGQILEARSGLC